jgi:hypothetical protein
MIAPLVHFRKEKKRKKVCMERKVKRKRGFKGQTNLHFHGNSFYNNSMELRANLVLFSGKRRMR